MVGYDSGAAADQPSLALASEGTVSHRSLVPGESIALTLGNRHCAGTTDEGTHVPCAKQRAPHCATHTESWVCARCTGDCQKPAATCEEPHVVYLALFAPDVVKVGVTRTWRFQTRLHEQGADRGAAIHEVPDGRIARQIEAALTDRFPDRIDIGTKVAGLGQGVDTEAWAEALAPFDVHERYRPEYGLALEGQPVRETVATGTIEGVKGRLLVLTRGATTYAVDMRDLVGHEVVSDGEPPALQSSLEAFDPSV